MQVDGLLFLLVPVDLDSQGRDVLPCIGFPGDGEGRLPQLWEKRQELL